MAISAHLSVRRDARNAILKLLFCICCVAFCCQESKSQQPYNQPNVSLNYQQIKLKKVLKDLSDKTGTHFSYNPRALPLHTEVTYQCTDKPTNEILKDIFAITNVQFEYIGNHVVLKPRSKNIDNEAEKPEKPLTYTISGFVSDSKNQETLIGAAVFDNKTKIGTITNNYGFFSLTLPQGEYNLQTSYVGYESISQSFELNTNQKWNIALQPAVSELTAIVVTSSNRESLVMKALAAQTVVRPDEAKKQTAALGETDMLKLLDNLPGISFQGDGSSYFYVRGGNRDQNLILLDEAPIYNPSHMLGLFTPIIPDAVKTTTIYKADFPIQEGGCLSSIVDIRTRDGNMERFSGSASIGLVATRLSLEGPFKKQASSYFVSYRKSHLGAFVKAANPNIKDLYFSDFNTKFNFRLGKNDRLFLTLYNGNDKYIANDKSSIANGLAWENSSFTARWNHLFSEKLFANTTFYASKYNYFLYTNVGKDLYWNSHISSSHLKSEFTWFVTPKNQVNYGLKLSAYLFNPGNHNSPEVAPRNKVSKNNSSELTLFAGNKYRITESLLVNYGIRLTSWSDYGEAFVVKYDNHNPVSLSTYTDGERYFTHNALEPRLSVSYKLTDLSTLKASYNRTLQHINLINNSISPLNSLEVWLPSGPNLKPQKANIFNVGFAHDWPQKSIAFNADVFYKKMFNQVGYSNHAETLLNPLLEGELMQGDGKAYGFELLLKKSQGRFTGQLGYGFTRSLLQIDGLNGNREYKAHQDRPIDLSLGMGYNIKPRWLATINVLYASGMMITTPTSFYYYRGVQVPVYTQQNNDRLPNYKRVDIGCDFKLNKRAQNFEHHLVVSAYNFFGHHNPSFLYFSKTVDSSGSFVIPTDLQNANSQVVTSRYIYSFVPSITYTLKF